MDTGINQLDFTARVYAIIAEKSISLTRLQGDTGLSNISRKIDPEKEKFIWTMKDVAAISKTYGVSKKWLLYGEGEMYIDKDMTTREPPKYLYHYTKWKNAKSILQEGKFRLGTFANTNDWTEKEYKGSKKYACFVGADSHEEGATISAMWSHYAEGYTGCCIVLDFAKFVEINNIERDNFFWVAYLGREELMEKRLNAGEEELLNYKSQDWSYEKELRILEEDRDCYFIEGCVEIVYIGQLADYHAADEIFNTYHSSLIEEWGAALTTKENAKGREDAQRIREKSRSVVITSKGNHALNQKPLTEKDVRVIDILAAAGEGVSIDFGDEENILGYVSIPEYRNCIGVMVYGNSMYDKYCSGDIVFVRKIMDINEIDNGQVYVVITNEDRYLKMVYLEEDGLVLSSYNMAKNPDGRRMYPDKKIDGAYVRHLYKVVGSLTRTQL